MYLQAELSLRPQPLVLVVDALDEVTVAGSGLAHTNPVLHLIREHLPNLPSTIRFVFTSRPEPYIEKSLEATIRPLQIRPGDPRHLEDLRELIKHELSGRLDGSTGGGVGSSGACDPTDEEISEAVQLLLSKSEGVFLYLAR
jgi:hypothetical protein